jgi:hypothetical protein
MVGGDPVVLAITIDILMTTISAYSTDLSEGAASACRHLSWWSSIRLQDGISDI